MLQSLKLEAERQILVIVTNYEWTLSYRSQINKNETLFTNGL